MPQYLIGLSVQNFDETIYDTEDLSTIRGASIGAINFVQDININNLSAVSTGGSKGLWTYDGDRPEDVVSILQERAREHEVAKHLCVAAAYIQSSNNFLSDKAALSALLARSRMRSATVPYPATAQADGMVCPVDLVSPVGSDIIWYGGRKQRVSPSVFARRGYGLTNKQKFVKNLACGKDNHDIFHNEGLNQYASFAMLLSSISEGAEPPPNLKSNLYDKIAVIHLDINGAGAAQRKAIEHIDSGNYEGQIKAQRKFDSDLGVLRKKLAKTVLDILHQNGATGAPSAEEKKLRRDIDKESRKVIRFEALLWAGDDITFIVPARLGWVVARALAEIFASNELNAAIGLIFCHHDAPIARIRALADSLCKHVKAYDRQQTLAFPLVLESFDHIGRGLADYLKKRAPTGQENSFFVLDADAMRNLQTQADNWSAPDSDMSRRQIRMAAVNAHRNRNTACTDEYRQSMLIEEYWDYLVPCPSPVASARAEGAKP
jgi:hypothetical protein